VDKKTGSENNERKTNHFETRHLFKRGKSPEEKGGGERNYDHGRGTVRINRKGKKTHEENPLTPKKTMGKGSWGFK